MKNKKFWNWVRNDAGESDVTDTPTIRTLYLNGVIASESWYGDEVTPQLFKDLIKKNTPTAGVKISDLQTRLNLLK